MRRLSRGSMNSGRYSAARLFFEGLRGHRGWSRAWKKATPRARYSVVIVGGGNSAGQAAMFLARACTQVHITIRGDGHYGRPEVMAWCEAHGVDYVLGLPTNAVLRADPQIVTAADACATKRAIRQDPVRCRHRFQPPIPRRRRGLRRYPLRRRRRSRGLRR